MAVWRRPFLCSPCIASATETLPTMTVPGTSGVQEKTCQPKRRSRPESKWQIASALWAFPALISPKRHLIHPACGFAYRKMHTEAPKLKKVQSCQATEMLNNIKKKGQRMQFDVDDEGC